VAEQLRRRGAVRACVARCVQLKFPHHFSGDLKDCVKNLLQVDITNRYGNMKNGADDIKNSKYFAPTNWAAIMAQTVSIHTHLSHAIQSWHVSVATGSTLAGCLPGMKYHKSSQQDRTRDVGRSEGPGVTASFPQDQWLK